MIRLNINEIERLREREGIRSQAELARRSGWTPEHMNHIFQETKRGRAPSFTIDKLDGLCRALRTKVFSILDHELEPPLEE